MSSKSTKTTNLNKINGCVLIEAVELHSTMPYIIQKAVNEEGQRENVTLY